MNFSHLSPRLRAAIGGIAFLLAMALSIAIGQPYTEHRHYRAYSLSAASGEVHKAAAESGQAETSQSGSHSAPKESSPGGAHEEDHSASHLSQLQLKMGKEINPIFVLPFIAILLAIALFPFTPYAEWWESNLHKLLFSVVMAALPFAFYWLHYRELLFHTLHEYVSFIVLLAALFVISGGILLKGDILGTPRNNTVMLLVGGFLASFIGTTGAAMLLVRPLVRINQYREHVTHIFVFLIFIVCNVGGCLTPLGDPPLFLGFLQGVPFFWTFTLWKEWVLVVGVLIVVFFFLDLYYFSKEGDEVYKKGVSHYEPLDLKGSHNFLFLGGVMLSVFYPSPFREINMIFMMAVSYILTAPRIRKENDFSFHAIFEVAAVFVGIFVTMIPALALLRTYGANLGLDHSYEFFWYTGVLSAFLDNAPTYLNFLSMARGMDIEREVAGVSHEILQAISLGAVFMGALTYIGNGPNFMVKTIVERAGRKMPSFVGYLGWSSVFLLPLFVAVTVIFLSS